MHKGTPAFEAAWKRIEAATDPKVAFRDEMLTLGHIERVLNLYRIKDKLSAKSVWFEPNKPQRDYLETRGSRAIILKCRQVGFTTLSGVEGLDYALWEPGMACGILAHLQGTVKTIFKDIIKYSYNHFLKDWGHLYRPIETGSSATELSFKEDGLGRELNSSMRVMFDFRGKTVHFFHVSEASRVEPDRLLGSLQGVPENGNIILESTPNGMGNEFFRQWQNWRTHKELAPYQGFFIPWYKHYPELPENWNLPEGAILTSREQELLNFGLTHSHLAWRRWCIEANCQGEVERFENEYPSNDIDCFSAGEGHVFPHDLVWRLDRYTKSPSKTGFLLMDGKRPKLHEDERGIVLVWEEPSCDKSYVIGADPSGGVGKDAAAAYVKCRETGDYVAAIHGNIGPREFGHELWQLAMWYNNAWINVEINNHGHATIDALKAKNYGKLYRRKVIDEYTNKLTHKVGFVTNAQSKLFITENLKTAFKKGTGKPFDKGLVSELTSFVQVSSKNGMTIRREAVSGAHDDRVMAAALTEEMDRSRGKVKDPHTERDADPGMQRESDWFAF